MNIITITGSSMTLSQRENCQADISLSFPYSALPIILNKGKGIININDVDLPTCLEDKINECIFSNYSPSITDYSYEPITKYSNKGEPTTYMRTTLTFMNGKSVSVEAPENIANQYTGFYTAVAKYYMGGDNTINDEAEYWIEKKPKYDEKIAKIKAKEAEEKLRAEERAKKNREKKRIRMEAIKRKTEYEAAVLANKKYGVPLDFRKDENNG